jgi:hypothetical protein
MPETHNIADASLVLNARGSMIAGVGVAEPSVGRYATEPGGNNGSSGGPNVGKHQGESQPGGALIIWVPLVQVHLRHAGLPPGPFRPHDRPDRPSRP